MRLKVFRISHTSLSNLSEFIGREDVDHIVDKLIHVTIREELRDNWSARQFLRKALKQLVFNITVDAIMDYARCRNDKGLLEYLVNDTGLGRDVFIRTYQINAFMEDNRSILYFEDYWSFTNSLTNNVGNYLRHLINTDRERYKECIFGIYEYLVSNFSHMPISTYTVMIANGSPCVIIEEKDLEYTNTLQGERVTQDGARASFL